MKLRHPFAALAALALAVAALTGCQSNVGTAAHVDSRTISAAAVDDQLATLSANDLAKFGKDAATMTIIGRNVVVTWLVREALFERVWDLRGGQPPKEKMDAVHDRAIQFLFNSPTAETGVAGDEAVRTALGGAGVKGDFGPTMVRAASLELVLADAINSTTEADVVKLVNDAGISVRINPRYGTWDTATLSLGATTLPSYVIDHTAPKTAPPAAVGAS